MIGKSVYLLAFFVSIVAIADAEPGFFWGSHHHHPVVNLSHNFVIGFRAPGDHLVLKQRIKKGSLWMYGTVTLQKTFNVTKNEKITQIRALDQKKKGNGGFASLVKGGPGTCSATLRFTSQQGHGLDFVVEIYARH